VVNRDCDEDSNILGRRHIFTHLRYHEVDGFEIEEHKNCTSKEKDSVLALFAYCHSRKMWMAERTCFLCYFTPYLRVMNHSLIITSKEALNYRLDVASRMSYAAETELRVICRSVWHGGQQPWFFFPAARIAFSFIIPWQLVESSTIRNKIVHLFWAYSVTQNLNNAWIQTRWIYYRSTVETCTRWYRKVPGLLLL
jgi:hypothetical protein